MADKIVLIKLDVQEAGAEAQIVNLNQKLSELTEGEKEYELVLKKIAIQEDRLSKIQAKRATIQGNVLKETQNTTKVLNKQSDATGSATAATMELSRVVSDAPYGIRGMANNITQLVSQLGSASVKAGGLTSALKLMWKSLMGPLGIVFAITAAVSALDYFYGANKKSEKSSESFEGSVAKSASALKILKATLDKNLLSTEEANRAVSKANSEYEDLNLKLDEHNKLTKDSVDAIDERILSLERLAKAQALQKIVEEEFSNIAKKRLELEKDIRERLEKIGAKDEFGKLTVEAYEKSEFKINKLANRGAKSAEILTRKSLDNQIKAFRDFEIQAKENIDKILKTLGGESLVDELFNPKKGKGRSKKPKKISPFKVGKELELDIKSNEAALLAFGKKTELQLLKNKEVEELNSAKTEEQRNIIKKRYAKLALIAQIENERKALLLKKATEKAILQGKYNTFQTEAELRRLAYIDTINKSKLTEEQKASAIKKANGLAISPRFTI